MIPAALQRLLDEGASPKKVKLFLESHTFPIVQGSTVTVVWFGQADHVNLRHWIFGLPSSTPLNRVPGAPLWYLTLEIPPLSRVEYKLEVLHGAHRAWVEDPLNPHHANDPFGINSVILGEGYQIPEWIHHDPVSRAGTLEAFSFDTKSLGVRGGQIYLPARFRRSRKYPLLIVHDGTDYLRYAEMKNILDNLIHRLEIPDLIVALIDSPDRLRDYANHEGHAHYIAEELLPWLAERFPLLDEPNGRGLMGASFGGVAALSTAARYPGRFGRLLLQSGSFAFSDIGRANRRGPAFEPVIDFMNHWRAAPKRVSERIFMSCGVYESLIYENRSLLPLLTDTGMEVRFVEARDGHNWDNWRDRLRAGLSYLFPGPLLFVYE